MLRIFGFMFLAAVLFFGLSQSASADEYGERFYNQTPSGMAEFTLPEETGDIAMDDVAESLQDVMPAAGEEAEAAPEPEEVIEDLDEALEDIAE